MDDIDVQIEKIEDLFIKANYQQAYEAFVRLCRPYPDFHDRAKSILSRYNDVRLNVEKGTLSLSEQDILKRKIEESFQPCLRHYKQYIEDNLDTEFEKNSYSNDYDNNLSQTKESDSKSNFRNDHNRIKVYISYAKEDFGIAKELRNDINKTGIKTWLAQPAKSSKIEVKLAIKNNYNFIMLLSRKALRNFNRNQQRIALNVFDEYSNKDNIYIIPVRIDKCETPDTRLQNYKSVDLFPSYEDGLSQILSVLGVGQPQQRSVKQITPMKPVITGQPWFKSLILTFGIGIISLLVTYIIFKFPKEAELIKDNYFTTIMIASAIYTILMFSFTKVYVTITKLHVNIQIILIPFIFFIMISFASATYLLDKPLINMIVEKISDSVITIIKNIELIQNDTQHESRNKGESPREKTHSNSNSTGKEKNASPSSDIPTTTKPSSQETREFFVKLGHYLYVIKHDYKDNEDGTISDYAMDLMWEKSGSHSEMLSLKTQGYINELNEEKFAGYNDWRLPTLAELTSLLSKKEQSNDLFIDPIFDKTQKSCWTSNENKKYGGMFYVTFASGGISCDLLCSESHYVRAVRSIK